MVISVEKRVQDSMITDPKRNDRVDRVAERAELQIVGGIIGAHGCPSLNAVAYGLASQKVVQADFFDWASI